MSNKKYKISFLFITATFLLIVSLYGAFLINNQTKSTVFASEQGSINSLEIANDGTYVSEELWTALYNVYFSEFGAPAENVLRTDSFVDFPSTTLNLSYDSKGNFYGIASLNGLELFNLDSFETVNLKGNNLSQIDDLQCFSNLKVLDLSNNNISDFSDECFSQNAYENLTFLNLSGNIIETCNLSNLKNASIDLSDNKLTKNSYVTHSENLQPVYLEFNYIFDVENNPENYQIGFQGTKDADKFTGQTKISFYEFDNIKTIQIFENDSLKNTLTNNQSLNLGVGNYSIKFLDENVQTQYEISFKVYMEKPTPKLFAGEKEVEFSTRLYNYGTLFFEGEEDSAIFISVNDSQYEEIDNIEINKNGTFVVRVYQTKGGYESEVSTYYIVMSKSSVVNWLIILLGCCGFVLLYFVYLKVSKAISKNAKHGKHNLD